MTQHVVVIGAGIVGACSALEALRRGFQVTILDPGEPGGEQSASYGNGTWLSPMSVIPPSTPGLWRKVPAWLADPLGPLAVRWSYLPRALPWLARYLWAGWTEAKVLRTARALRPLLVDSPALYAELAAAAGVPGLIRRQGLMYVYPDRAAFEAEALAWRVRAAVGVEWQEIPAEEMRQREPELDPRYRFGVLVGEGGNCRDPGGMVAALVALAKAEGALHVAQRATGLRIVAGRLAAVTTDGGEILADRAVIAAGAHSKALAAAAGDHVPLETERGYHALLKGVEIGPRIPLMPSDGKMSVSMTEAGLRCAGQVEIAGLEAAPNWQRAEILRDWLLAAFPNLPRELPADQVKVWMGHRPSMPDGLPCLGFASGTPDVIHAFGHGHVGLVAGPRTGRIVGALLAGEEPEIPIAAFDPRRFA
ncbi:D-amino-acid dehydrogenase [Humitalea rosea]|uniref:D-amino-acid dehydrogenase n=1 Tax=Humitalea rosea TaxID=990373 RepID=A0A2W7JAI1_9PROT|nr:FAD-binding oxidoreductase [Humitalea rosea]PZW49145.1 D-amino-acid dehydrogenase [Humitalea rosea]